MPLPTATTRRNPNSARRQRGAAMAETVLVLPFIMFVIVLLVYFGWNFRRLALVTNMDRYAVWEQVTPGSPGPDIQRLQQEVRNPRLNNMFFGLNNDQGLTLDEWARNDGYRPQAHQELLEQQADETYSYFDAFLGASPGGIRERFVISHDHLTDSLDQMGMSDTMRNKFGHQRLNGDWRYANGIRNDSDDGWVASGYRVAPGNALRDVFFAELDDQLEAYSSNGNTLADAIQAFYSSYPGYRGPRVGDESHDD